MGGRGSSSGMPVLKPTGNGSSGNNKQPMDQFPGAPKTLKEALGKKGREMSIKSAIMKANPFYDGTYREYSENCQRAVVAVEARFRGYDVIAQPTYDNDTMPSHTEWLKAFKNPKPVSIVGSKLQTQVRAQMAKYGDGARAVMSFRWKGRGTDGHVINVLQRNGKTYFYDGQTGGIYSEKALFTAIKPSVELTRVDNLSFGPRAREAFRQNPNKKK